MSNEERNTKLEHWITSGRQNQLTNLGKFTAQFAAAFNLNSDELHRVESVLITKAGNTALEA